MSLHDTAALSCTQRSETEQASIIGHVLHLLLASLELASEADVDAQPSAASAKRGRGRPLQLPWAQLWSSLLLCTLSGMDSFAAWRRFLGMNAVGPFAPLWLSSEALVKRLRAAGLSPLQELWAQLNDQLACAPWLGLDPALAAFASAIFCLDETKLDRLHRHLEHLRTLPPTDAALFAGKLLGLFDLRAQRWLRLEWHEKVWENCLVDLLPFLQGLPVGSLLLFDLGYFCYAFFDALTQQGLWWISRYRDKASYQIAHTFYRHNEILDALVWLGSGKNQAGHLVRLVRFGDGLQVRMYFTNVCDPAVLSLADIAHLYARRWDIEMAFRLMKEYLGMRHWWSGKLELIHVQIWVVLILSQLLWAVRQQMAVMVECDLFEVSMPLLVERLAQWPSSPQPLFAQMREQGKQMGLLRRSTRLSPQVPPLSLESYQPPPPDLPWYRTPRYSVSASRSGPSGYSGYATQRARNKATKQAHTQRVALAKAAKAAKPKPGAVP